MEIEPIEAAVIMLKKSGVAATVSKTGILATPKAALAMGVGSGLIGGMIIATLGMVLISYIIDKAAETNTEVVIPPL